MSRRRSISGWIIPATSFGLAVLLSVLAGPSRRALARTPGMQTCPEGACNINPARRNEFMFPPFLDFEVIYRIPPNGPMRVTFVVDNTVEPPGGYLMRIRQGALFPIQTFTTAYGVTHDLNGNTGPGEDLVQHRQRTQLSVRALAPGGTRTQAFHLHSLTTTVNGTVDTDAVLNAFEPGPANIVADTINETVSTSNRIGTCTNYTGEARVFAILRADRLAAGPTTITTGSARRIRCDLLPGD